ncbi:Signal peptidase complex subunit 2 [Ascosphaera apis ARSEF 7405]|uniref:Signal peptidase complex subunit 2 n=1 Tax=Ascosphaera apis ARSEF 7405 TaxID=392613 RepID=A0A168DNY6_9EURO|nr:Signal peptidase complex subunit 2 [Ascosphaera apis ARSEF 7405]
MSPVPLYSVNDLKSATDDAIPLILTSSKLPTASRFTQDHAKSNVRLILGYTAVLIGAITFWADRKYDFNTTYPYVTVAVCIYFALNAALTGWIFFVEKGCVFEGVNGKGERIQIYSSGKQYTKDYKLQIKCVSKEGKVLQNESVVSGYNAWFSTEGVLYREQLKKWLVASIVPLKGVTDEQDEIKDEKR